MISLTIVFDKKFNFKIFKIRNYYDYITVREIFVLECYKFDHLIKYKDIIDSYENIIKKNKKPLIVDCGSNIGASSYYFSNKYKESQIVSIEPDEGNFELLKININGKFIDINQKVNFMV